MTHFIRVRCEGGHETRLTLAGVGLEYAETYCGLLDGTSPLFVIPVGPESVIGKCCWPVPSDCLPGAPTDACGKPFKATIESSTEE